MCHIEISSSPTCDSSSTAVGSDNENLGLVIRRALKLPSGTAKGEGGGGIVW